MNGKAANKKVRAFLVVLTVCLPLIAAGIHVSSASTSIRILADGEIYPSTVPISTVDNVTYVFNGNINGTINIERSGITLDGKMYMLVGGYSGTGVNLGHIQGVTVKNINVLAFAVGIQLSFSFNNTIEGNLVHSSIGGITLDASYNNTILRNVLYINFVGGLSLLEYSTANEVTENNITSNGHFGIYDDSSSGNYFCHNMFFNNPTQALMVIGSEVNTWDDGYPSGGNYWSYYTGPDLLRGPYQNETGSDGIGDIPYIIDSNNKDNYPLMNASEALHNIAVTQVTPWLSLIRGGQILNVTVSVQNSGIYNETFNLALTVNTTTLETRTLTLSGFSSADSIFSWNTTDSPTGNYTFTATADQVAGETDIQDNVLTSGAVALFTTQLRADPSSISVPIGQVFYVNVTLADVLNLTAWQFGLFFNSTVLNCTGVSEGPFLQSAGTTFFTYSINNTYGPNEGYVLVGCSFLGQNVSASGTGVLAFIEFSTLARGSSALHLTNTEFDDNSYPIKLIPCITSDGFARVTEAGFEVDPSPSVAPVNYDIYFNVTLTDVYNLTAWQFGLLFDSTVLNCTGVIEGPFLQSAGTTIFTRTVNNTYDATHGHILVGCSLLGQNTWVNGNGTIAIIEFTSLNVGNTSLHFDREELDDNSYPLKQIPCTLSDGFVRVVPAVHDIAVNLVAPYKTIVGRTYLENVTVTVENQGVFTENFSLTIYANASAIDMEAVTLASGNLSTITYPWNTSGFVYGSYTLSAYAAPVSGENNTTNNLYTDGSVKILVAGDVSGPIPGVPDGKIDMRDIAYIARRFLVKPIDPLWDPNADLNTDGKIDMRDIAIAAKNFGIAY